MKTIMTMLAVLISTVAFAETKEMGPEALAIADALLDRGVVEAAAAFAKEANGANSVTVEQLEDVTVYKITGTIFRGGDIPCGSAVLTIKKSWAPQFGFPGSRVATHSGEVQIESRCD